MKKNIHRIVGENLNMYNKKCYNVSFCEAVMCGCF